MKYKTITALLLCHLFLVSCAARDNYPLLFDPSTDRLRLNLTAETDPLDLHARIARGKGQGALLGAGGGMLSCIGAGAYTDEMSGTLGIGMTLGILVSPVCGLFGGFYGGSEARPRAEVVNHQMSVQQDLDQHYPHVILDPIIDSITQSTLLEFAEPVSHQLDIKVLRIRLVGRGIDPPLRLQAETAVCLHDLGAKDSHFIGNVRANSRPYRLDEWADGGDYLIQYETNQMALGLASKIQIKLLSRSRRSLPCRDVKS